MREGCSSPVGLFRLIRVLLSLSRSSARRNRRADSPKSSWQRSAAQQTARSTVASSPQPTPRVLTAQRSAKVRRVLDGDTVIVVAGREVVRVRLDSIDCPEADQPWGDIAKAGLIKLIGGRDIHLEEYGLDHHGRTLATLFVEDRKTGARVNVNERMVTLGHAWVMRHYYDHLPNDRKAQLNRLERWAKGNRVGLWQTPEPVPPWSWRRETS